MVFSSPIFISVFFPILLALYFFAGKRGRNSVLFIFSILFYTWGEPTALPIMLLTILFNYYLALKTASSPSPKYIFIIGILINLGILCIFKYLDFIVQNINYLLTILDFSTLPQPHIMLPIGISFYIFQALSYFIDVHRKVVAPQKSLFHFALYISLFPQLVAGPIVRYASIANELGNRVFIAANVQSGLIRFCIGLAKKVFIADSLGYIADCIFDTPVHTIPCLWAWVGALAYAMQIYFDFSAYSDMAIGIGKIFNFHFPENFNFPYAARTIQEFWRRWHMSLTSWLKDYLYIPLGGNRKSSGITYRNILIVLLCCGIWHGAAWNFVVWGLYNGVGLIAERWLKTSCKAPSFLSAAVLRYFHWIITILFILIGWVIFRSDTLAAALTYIKILFTGNPDYSFYSLAIVWERCLTYSNGFFLILALLFSQPIKHVSFEAIDHSLIAQAGILLLFLATYAFIMTSDYSPFLYFRF